MGVTVANLPGIISIHALRGEGDPLPYCWDTSITLFLSTPSVGRATAAVLLWQQVLHISIHALRGEGDGHRICG